MSHLIDDNMDDDEAYNDDNCDLFPPTQLMKPEDYEPGHNLESPPHTPPQQTLPVDWLADELDRFGPTIPRGGIACASFSGNHPRFCWICGSTVQLMHENVICSSKQHLFHYCERHNQV